MNWENSKACTPLKRDILKSWFKQETRYFLTGGSALGIFYLDHRYSYDLDFFTNAQVSNIEIQNLTQRIAKEIKADLKTLQTNPDFNRFLFTRNDERELIDVVTDLAPQLDKQKVTIGQILVDTTREIIANKLTTILSRTEAKDLIDLYFLEQAGHDILASIPDAKLKDGGWDPAMASMLLESINIEELPPFIIKDIDSKDLLAFKERLRLSFANDALPHS